MVRTQVRGTAYPPLPGDSKFHFAASIRLTATINWLANVFTTIVPRYLHSLASFVSRSACSAEWRWR